MNDDTNLPSTTGEDKLTQWSNEPTLQTLKGDLESSKPNHDAIVARVKKWNDLLKITGSAKPPVVKGHSSVQPKLVRRQAEWRYPALSEPFLSSSKLFKVTPTTYEDHAAAEQNQLVLNWQFRTKLNRIKFIDNFVRSVVDDGTVVAKIGWCRYVKKTKKVVPVFEHYQIQDQNQMQQLQQALQMREENPRMYNEQVPEEIKAAVEYYEESGIPTYAQQSGEEEIDVETVIENQPTVDVLNLENVYIDPSCNGDLNKALFVITTFETNKAELKKEGKRYKNLDKVLWEGQSLLTEPDHVSTTPGDFNLKDATRKKVVAYEYWGYYDVANNGILVPIVATWIGNTLIRMEENPFPDQKLPFILVVYSPVKRDLFGEPDAELLEENQQILGATTRGVVDLLGRSANGQQGIAKGMLDPLNRRRFDNGQDYEYNPNLNPQMGLVEHKFPEIPRSALELLNLQNQDAEALTGVKSFSGGLSGSAYGDVAAGIRGMLDASSKREMGILRRLAKGMIEIGQKIIAMNAEFLSEEEVIRVTNDTYVTIKREDLKGEFDLEVDISTAEVDNEKARDLGFMLQTMGPNMDPKISAHILGEIAELKRMPALAKTLKDWQPQPDPMAQQLQQLELQKKQKEIEELDSKIALNKANADKARSEADLKNLDFVEQEGGTKHAREKDIVKAQSEGNANAQITKALTTPRKVGETKPNILAAVGFNEMKDRENDWQTGPLQDALTNQPSPINFGGR